VFGLSGGEARIVTKIYIAAKFGARERLRAVRDAIHAQGHGQVISSWLDAENEVDTHTAQAREGQRDYLEVVRADLVIVDTSEPTRRGGREVELGIALGRGIDSWVVGRRVNVFHYLVRCHADWPEALAALGEEKRRN
jgi:hypothetical protein